MRIFFGPSSCQHFILSFSHFLIPSCTFLRQYGDHEQCTKTIGCGDCGRDECQCVALPRRPTCGRCCTSIFEPEGWKQCSSGSIGHQNTDVCVIVPSYYALIPNPTEDAEKIHPNLPSLMHPRMTKSLLPGMSRAPYRRTANNKLLTTTS